MKKVKLILLVTFVSVMSYLGYYAFNDINMTQAERLMLQNVEALTYGEGVETEAKCDILKYNRNMREAWINHTVKGQFEAGTYITLPNGKRIKLGISVNVSLPIQYPDCVSSYDNCCIKTHIDKNIKYL